MHVQDEMLRATGVYVNRTIVFAAGLFWASLAAAQNESTASVLTELDFLGEMPVVLSVSRLAQRLDDAPGAVTILDRHFIRMSGARDVADLLRVVPGFQTATTFETDAQLASYHGRVDDWSNRLQVLIDGRSVYSSALQGSVGIGLQTLALEDVERIEILRGSNSAAYGARAFLGVVNIVSRDVRQTLGNRMQLTTGDNAVADLGASLGWGNEQAAYRVSVDSRGDEGLRKTGTVAGNSGRNRVSRINFSGFGSLGDASELNLRVGLMEIEAFRGDFASQGNLQRLRFMGSGFGQLDWRRTLSADEEVKVGVSVTRFENRDGFPYLESGPSPSAYSGIRIGFDSNEVNSVVDAQYTRRYSPALRTVMGAEIRSESLQSASTFDGLGPIQTRFLRAYANAEWFVVPSLVINAGALAEQSTLGGDTFSPRAMANWHVSETQTLRAGASTAFRPPSPYEKFALVNYYDTNGANPLTYVRAKGLIAPEKVFSRELGYHLNVPKWGVDGDLRIFNERISDGIRSPYTANGPPSEPVDFVNSDNYDIKGVEFQVQWKPTANTRLFWSQTWTDITGLPLQNATPGAEDLQPYRVQHSAARLAGSLAVMHTFANGADVSLVYHDANESSASI